MTYQIISIIILSPFHKRPGLLKDIILHPIPYLHIFIIPSFTYLFYLLLFGFRISSCLDDQSSSHKGSKEVSVRAISVAPFPTMQITWLLPLLSSSNRWQFNDGKRFYECSQGKYFLIATYQMYTDVNVASAIRVSKCW